MPKTTRVASKKDLPVGKTLSVTIGHKQVAVFNIAGKYYALDDACTHASGPLSDGTCEGTVVTCPWHGATFDIVTGKALSAPAFDNLNSYQVLVEGEDLKVVMPD